MATEANIKQNIVDMIDQNKKVKGFTLTELAIVMGVVGMILGAIWVAASAVYTNQRIQHANTQVLQMLQGTRTIYGNVNNISPVSSSLVTTLINAQVVPNDMVGNCTNSGTNNCLFSPWSGNVDVSSSKDGLAIIITYDAMPTAVCVGLVGGVGGVQHDRAMSQNTQVAAATLIANGGTTTGVSSIAGTATLGNQMTSGVQPVVGAVQAGGTFGGTNLTTGCTAAVTTNSAAFVYGLRG